MTTSTSRLCCRSCGASKVRSLVDLGFMPPANEYLDPDAPPGAQKTYPLHAFVCEECILVQIEEAVSPEDLFGDYAYFSSYSSTWIEHGRRFVEDVVKRFHLASTSSVLEVASNDGYLLRHFVDKGIPVLGIEPAENVASVAIAAGIPTEVRFFGRQAANDLVRRGFQADLVVANNVIAHVPDLNDFVAGMATVLRRGGVVSVEFPHLMNLIDRVQFDTIYHEHYSYFSLCSLEPVFSRHGLRIFDVKQIPTHGGSLRVFACQVADDRPARPGVAKLYDLERAARLHDIETYDGFSERVEHCRRSLRQFLTSAKTDGRTVVAYGAAAKGSTLLNYCEVTDSDIAYVVDRSPHKQGHLLPGSRLPIFAPERVLEEPRPDFLLLLAWNLEDEITKQMAYVREWGCRFVVPIPEMQVLP